MTDMPVALPPHLHRQTNRQGKTVWYVRVGHGPRIRIRGAFGTVEFMAAYDQAVSGQGPAKAQRGPVEGTFSWGVSLYMRSQAWAVLAPTTREVRGNILRAVEKTGGASKLRAWRKADVAAGRDRRADRPAAARHFVDTLRGMFEWLLEAGLVVIDPTAGVKVARPKTEGFPRWGEEEVEKFRRHWPLGTRERVAFEILRETGLRRGDAVRLGRPHLRGGVIRLTTEKTGQQVSIAASQALLDAIAAGPVGEMTFIYSRTPNRPMDKDVFGIWFRKAVVAAGIEGRSAHGLRKAAATSDALDGWADAELDAKFGWRGRQMARLYTDEANRERLSLGASKRTKSGT